MIDPIVEEIVKHLERLQTKYRLKADMARNPLMVDTYDNYATGIGIGIHSIIRKIGNKRRKK